jgi:long-chain acyl-CoA synthetase
LPALEDATRAWSYTELLRESDECGTRLAALGVCPGDRVLIVGETCAELVAMFFGAASAGAAAVIVSARMAAPEVDRIAGHCEPAVIVYFAAQSDVAAQHGRRRGAAEMVFPGIGAVLVERAERGPERGSADSDRATACAAMIYTSGTTGRPKAAMLSHRNLLFAGATQARERGHVPGDLVYCPLPMAHVGGLCAVLLGTLAGGGCVVLRKRFVVEELVDLLGQGRVTVIPGIPAMHLKVLEWAKRGGRALDTGRLRLVTTSSSPLAPSTKSAVESMYGMPLQSHYGMTEASAGICQTTIGLARADVSVGRPFPGIDLRIVGAEGVRCSHAEVGEIQVRGAGVFMGYFRDADSTTAAFTVDGWLRTFDLGRQDASGDVFIAGRAKDVIKRSGYNIYPIEVEAAISAAPFVVACCVVGRMHEADEEVIAFVELSEGGSVAAVKEHLGRQLAPYKMPNQIRVLARLPTLESGKIDRKALHAEAASG